MKIAEGSNFEIKIEQFGPTIIISQLDQWVKFHVDDLQEIIEHLRKCQKLSSNNQSVSG